MADIPDSNLSRRSSMNNDGDFIVGGPRDGGWTGILAPAVRARGMRQSGMVASDLYLSVSHQSEWPE